jgi:N-acetylglucosaminyl-diphospho-decaprenol L-rhamnosyltransferase
MTYPRILTIILNYKTPELTVRAAAAAVSEMRALGGEVVIVENASNDGSLDQLRAAVGDNGWTNLCRVVESPVNGGFGAGCNLGMRQGLSDGTAPDFYYLLNSDAWPDRGAVKALLDVMRDHPHAGMAGSHIRGEDGQDHCTAFRFPSIAGEFESAIRLGLVTRLLRNAVVPMEIPAQTTPIDWTAGASLLLRREMLDQIGPFDETFFLYFEETELCHRASAAGWQTYYVPQSRVTHIGSVSTGLKIWARTPQYWFESRQHYFTKVHGRLYAGAATAARIAGAALWRLRRLVSHRPMQDPPHFLRDLILFSLKPTRRQEQVRLSPVAHRPATEDSK